MGLQSVIKKTWDNLATERAETDSFWGLSPSYVVLFDAIAPAIRQYGKGVTLDAGAGKLPYRKLLRASGASYIALDKTEQNGGIDIVADVQDIPLENGSIDTVFCSQVIEHIPEPASAFAEFYRILRPGGNLILTAPHLGYLHNEPYDFYRYTGYGLTHMAEAAGFRVVTVEPVGGLLSYQGHLASTVFIGLLGGVPMLGSAAVLANSVWSRAIAYLDRYVGNARLFALNFLLVAGKE